MTRLIHTDGTVTTDYASIQATLAGWQIALTRVSWTPDAELAPLIGQDQLSAAEHAQLLSAVIAAIQPQLGATRDQAHDMVVFHPQLEGLTSLRQKFLAIHRHADDEVRYIVSGRGFFGFVTPDGTQALLEVEGGDFLNVPRGAAHWFALADDPRLKALRFFGSRPNWEAQPTEFTIHPALLAAQH